MDRARQTMGRATILPLKRHEQRHLTDNVTYDHSGQQTGLQAIVLHAALTGGVYALTTHAVRTCKPGGSAQLLWHCVAMATGYALCLLGLLARRTTSRANTRISEWFYPKRARQRADWFIGLQIYYILIFNIYIYIYIYMCIIIYYYFNILLIVYIII